MAVRWWHMLLAISVSVAAHASGLALVPDLHDATSPAPRSPEEVRVDIWALGVPDGAVNPTEIAPLGLPDTAPDEAGSAPPLGPAPRAGADQPAHLHPLPQLRSYAPEAAPVTPQSTPADPTDPDTAPAIQPALPPQVPDLPAPGALDEPVLADAQPNLPSEQPRRPLPPTAVGSALEPALPAGQPIELPRDDPSGVPGGVPSGVVREGNPLGIAGGTGDRPRRGLLSGSVSGTTDPKSLYAGQLYEVINEVARRRYPRQARRLGLEGTVIVNVIVASDGTLDAVTLADRENAPPGLARAAIKAVEEAAPFPPFPEELNEQTLAFVLRVTYRLQ